MKKNPFFHIVIHSDRKTKLFSLLYMGLNFLSALTEGLTFSFLLLGLSIHATNDEPPSDFISQKIMSIFPWHLSFTVCFLMAIGSQLVRSLATLASCFVFARISTVMQEAVQTEILKKIFSFNFPYVNRYRAGELSDIACLPANCLPSIVANINHSFLAFLISIALLCFMFSISIPLTLIMFSLLAMLGFAYKSMGKLLAVRSKDYSDKTAAMSSEIVESIGAIRYVHYYQNGHFILQKLGMQIRVLINSLKRMIIWNSAIVHSSEVVAVILVAALLLIGSYLHPLERTGAPILLIFLGASYRFVTRIQGFVGCLGIILLNWGHITRMNEFLREEGKEFLPVGGISPPERKKSIRFEEVSLVYPGKTQEAVRNISFEIPFGATIGFAGTSGSGKSTLLDLLIRLYEPTSGKITTQGLKCQEIDLSKWRSLFGIVNQDIFLFNDTIEANIRFGKASATSAEIEQASKLAGAHSFITGLPQGYQTVIGERGTRLSGGERQRIAIARALIRNPEILVLDEATSSLDTETEKVIQTCLLTLQGKKTLIVVAHRLSTLVNADHIYVIDEGRIIEQGSHSKLLALNGKYASLWNLQISQSEKAEIYES